MQKDNIQKFLKNSLSTIKKQRDYVKSLDSLPSLNIDGFSKFYTDSSINISFQYSEQVISIEDQKLYLSLFEKTTNFNLPPKSEETQLIGNQLIITADFKVTNSVNSTIFVMFYNENKNIKTLSFKQNGAKFKQAVNCPDGAKSYRLAIRLEGTGTFKNSELTIKQTLGVNEHKNGKKSSLEKKGSSQISNQENITNFKEIIKGRKYYRQVKNNGLKVASILDEFSEECFKYDCDLLPLSKEGWKQELEEFKPDFLFVESCWRGNGRKWEFEVANLQVNTHRVALKEITDYCKQQNIKTVFWDKEGVENFDFFKEAASYFDYIFTADENNIDNFKNFTKNENVFILAFAAQPQIHNPIYKNKNYLGEIAFGGSYYNNKHDLRKKDIENIIKPSIKYDSQIFDRYFNTDPKKVPNNQWPEEYRNNIVGSLNYKQMVEAYKNFDIFLNVNSVQNSKYMFARRVFEILASRTMVISGPSLGVSEMFNGLVPITDSKNETENLLKIYLKNPILREKLEKEGSRFVLQNHTYQNRLQQICDAIGIKVDLLKQPKVSIVASTQRDEFLQNLYQNIKHQTYNNIEIVIVLNKNSMDVNKWQKQFEDLDKSVKVIQKDESISLGYCLNEAIALTDGDIIAKFDDDDYYAPNYLLDMVLSMGYSNADIVGKSAHYVYLESKNLLIVKTMGAGAEGYTDFVSGATLVFTRKMFEDLGGFADRSRGEDSDLLRRAKEKGYLIYSNDTYNFCLFRRKNTSSHTWQVDENELLRNSTSHSLTLDYKTPLTF
jgi:spore maturation protein CgeB